MADTFFLRLQHSEEMYDPEIYRHQISEYYNPYVLEADIQAGEFNFDIVPSNGTCSIRSFYFRKRANVTAINSVHLQDLNFQPSQ